MKNSKMLNAYANSEREAAVDSEDPHTLICVLFDELCRSMNIFFTNLDKKNADLELRSKALSKSLNVIYALQTSLNFEAGGEIAENLFRLYEYARQQLLASAKSEDPEGVRAAINSLSEIRDAWRITTNSALQGMSSGPETTTQTRAS